MQLGRYTVTVEPFFGVLVAVATAVGLLADDPRFVLLPAVALTVLLARTLGAFAAGTVALLGGARWAALTIGVFPTPTAVGTQADWSRRLEPVAGLVGALTGVAAVYLLQAGLAPVAPSVSVSLELACRVVGTLLLVACVPMLPMDGGQVVQELLPGAAVRRARLAGLVSVLSGLVLVVLALQAGSWFVAVALVLNLWVNACRAAGRGHLWRGGHVCGHSCDVLGTLYFSGYDRALELHHRRRRETDPLLAVLMDRWHALDDPATTSAVTAALAGRPDDEVTCGAYLLWCARTDRRAELTATVVDARPMAFLPMAVAVHEAALRGADREVVLLAERVLHVVSCTGVATSAVALRSATSRIRLGDLDRAVADLTRCRGWLPADLDTLHAHPDLAPVRQHPAWPSLQATLPKRVA